MIDRDPAVDATSAQQLPSRQHNPGPRWAALAAAPGIRNPAVGAHRLLSCARDSLRAPPSLGRVPPVLLSGDGARRWCAAQQLATAGQETPLSVYQVTDEARRQWLWCRQQDQAAAAAVAVAAQAGTPDLGTSSLPATGGVVSAGTDSSSSGGGGSVAAVGAATAAHSSRRSDTVGAVVIDQFGRVASGASSGGVLYKPDGRVGSAACYGAGCWAAEGVGATASGTGEQLIQAQLPRRVCEELTAAAAARVRGSRAVGAQSPQQQPAESVDEAGGAETIVDGVMHDFVADSGPGRGREYADNHDDDDDDAEPNMGGVLVVRRSTAMEPPGPPIPQLAAGAAPEEEEKAGAGAGFEVVWSHNSSSFGVAYLSGQMDALRVPARCVFSRLGAVPAPGIATRHASREVCTTSAVVT